MELLRMLTLIYTAVLVLALAAGLIAIWIYLRRIASALGEARAALAVVKDGTEPLGERLERLHEGVTGPAGTLAEARARLERADERLGVIAERLGATEFTS